ncbi:putative velvet factor [Lyophyllum shimeji]|uniref:Velvet factor n=1 Tax=Lyophyllum shimeji TaxID=47721 RepID=A0A9P3PQ07_LYOSH|nr:putative velvet factor [Lyophyllum shimeji]
MYTHPWDRSDRSTHPQADLGRKYAKVDRRPLDPPPVVHLRLFQVYDAGTDREMEKEIEDYEEVQVLGLLCTVDLFPVPPSPDTGQKHQRVRSAPAAQASFPSTSSSSHFHMNHQEQPFTFAQPHTYSMSHSLSNAMIPSPDSSSPLSSSGYRSASQPAADVVHTINGFQIRESSKMTSSLVGATFVQPAIIDYQGQKSVLFVFPDLAVKIEGKFILRYRVFDIFSKPYNYRDLAVQAECYGGPFRIYSTKEFPGLQASTELTKVRFREVGLYEVLTPHLASLQQLARWGVRLNTRETERRRRKKGAARSASPLYTTTGKRKLPSPGSDELTTYESERD